MSSTRWPHWKGGKAGVTGLNQHRARNLLQDLQRSMSLSGISSGRRTYKFGDGTIIDVAIVMGTATINVVQPQVGGKKPRQYPNPRGFVVTAKASDLLNGIHAEYDQQIILAPLPPESEWITLTYDDQHTAGESDGTYKNVFAEGVRFAGNIDWLGADGTRLYWYGPSRRYWYDCWRKPDAQYGQWVFLNGQILLNTQAHAFSSERYVLGAALHDGYLYVMQADINAFATDYAAMYPAPRNYSWVSPPYPDGDTTLRLCRYRVLEDTKTNNAAARYSIAPDSGVSLWTDTRRGYVNPWFFNPDATVCETFAMPDELRSVYGNNVASGTSGGTRLIAPSATNESMVLSRAADDEVTSEVTSHTMQTDYPLWAPNTTELLVEIAADYAVDGTRRSLKMRHLLVAGFGTPIFFQEAVYLQIDDGPYVTITDSNESSGGSSYVELNALLYVNIRDGIVVKSGSRESEDFNLYCRAYREGALIAETAAAYDYYPLSNGGRFINSIYHGRRGLNRDFGVVADAMPYYLYTTASPISSISPLWMVAGIQVSVSCGDRSEPSERRVSDAWLMGALTLPPFVVPTEQLEGRCVFPGSDTSSTSGPLSTVMIGIAAEAGVVRGLETTDGTSPYYTVDSLGYGVPQSAALDSEGNFLGSFTAPATSLRAPQIGLETLFPNDWYRSTVRLALSTGPTLAALTGVAGDTSAAMYYDNPLPNLYDARYSTVWQLGVWPVVGFRPTEE